MINPDGGSVNPRARSPVHPRCSPILVVDPFDGGYHRQELVPVHLSGHSFMAPSPCLNISWVVVFVKVQERPFAPHQSPQRPLQ